MIFRHFLTSVNESNAFIVACEETRDALLVDAGAFDPAMAEFIEDNNLRLVKVFITHDHFDHTDGLDAVVAQYKPEILAGKKRAGGRGARAISHGEEISVGALRGRVLATPGHTQEDLCLVMPCIVFTGDTLFAGSIGGTSSASAQRQEIENIRQHIFTLPEDYEIHTGHGPSSTVGIERRHNPFFV